jgi:hypothetical protein
MLQAETSLDQFRVRSLNFLIDLILPASLWLGVAKRAVKDWVNKNHIKQWESITGLKQAKELIIGPSAERSEDLLKLSRGQL